MVAGGQSSGQHEEAVWGAEWVHYMAPVVALRKALNVTEEGSDNLRMMLNVTYSRWAWNRKSKDACPTQSFLLDLEKHVHFSPVWMRVDSIEDGALVI